MLVDRTLRAFLSFGAGAVGSLLRCVAPPDAPSGEPRQVVQVARETAAVGVVLGDLDGEAVVHHRGQTVSFGLDGQTYEIDLSDERATELRTVLQRYIDAGRRDGRQPGSRGTGARGSDGRVRPRPPAATGQRHDPAAIRAWARAHGHQVSDRGRIPATVLQAYEADKRRGHSGTP